MLHSGELNFLLFLKCISSMPQSMLAHLQNLLSGMQLSQDVLMILFFIIILMSTNKSPTQRKLTKYVLNERMNELDEWMKLPPVVRRLGQCTLNFPLIYLSGNFFKFSHLIFQINVKFVFYAEWPTCPVLLGTFLVFPLKVSYPRKTFSSGQTGTAGHPNSSPYYLHD